MQLYLSPAEADEFLAAYPTAQRLTRVRRRSACVCDDYPNFEVILYRPGKEPRDLGRDQAGWAGGLNAMPPAIDRSYHWVNGQCRTMFGCDQIEDRSAGRSRGRQTEGRSRWVIDLTHTPRRHPWQVFLIPVVLGALVLVVSWLWPFFAPLGPVRAAHPLVGPADTITLPMRPGVEYLIYHSAPESEVGRDCRFGSPGHVAGGIGVGGIARSDVAYRGVAGAVTAGGRTFQLAFRADNSISVDVPISCTSGPVLAEEMPACAGQALAGSVGP